MLYFVIIILTAAITVLIIAVVSAAKKTEMPNPFKKEKNEKSDMGILSNKWISWLQENFSSESGHFPIYDRVIPRKIRQKRYAESHKVNFHEIINDILYDTDIADEFLVQQTMFMGNEPCAKHYYATTDHKTFFFITSRLGHKDECNSMTLKEVKRLLGKDPEKYSKYVPGAERNEDIQRYIELKRQREQEEEEKKKKEQEKQEELKKANENKQNVKKAKIENVKSKKTSEKVKEEVKSSENINGKIEINENKSELNTNIAQESSGAADNVENQNDGQSQQKESDKEEEKNAEHESTSASTVMSESIEDKNDMNTDENGSSAKNESENVSAGPQDPMCTPVKRKERKKMSGNAFSENVESVHDESDIEDDWEDIDPAEEPDQDERIDAERT